ncbi:hypothetical protein FB595_11865 [Sphingobium sp. AEW010]|nr:hypothetical protein FB595_11865 [Sphingobium sp. AEW010]TWD19845.1 hypothetical protein FB596_11865 [Sphingobium sp. AEW013]TWD22392.1 hypothetical protein FB594_11865 [Sphingobium sp. AEW001]
MNDHLQPFKLADYLSVSHYLKVVQSTVTRFVSFGMSINTMNEKKCESGTNGKATPTANFFVAGKNDAPKACGL